MPLTEKAAYEKDKRTGGAAPELQHRHFAFIADILANSGERPEALFEPLLSAYKLSCPMAFLQKP